MTALDFAILQYIQQHIANPLLDYVMIAITHLGDYGIMWIALCVILLAMPKTRRSGVMLAVAMVAGLVICNIVLKNAIARPRPFMVDSFPILINPPMGYSFPSGHSCNSFVAATVIGMNYKRYRTVAFVMALLIAFSRVYLYVHYPSDVIAGAAIGAGIGYITVRLFGKYKRI